MSFGKKVEIKIKALLTVSNYIKINNSYEYYDTLIKYLLSHPFIQINSEILDISLCSSDVYVSSFIYFDNAFCLRLDHKGHT